MCNDNDALVDRIKKERLHGNYGLNFGMSVMLETRRLKEKCNKINFRWVKGHQDHKSYEDTSDIYLNNKCNQIANVKRD